MCSESRFDGRQYLDLGLYEEFGLNLDGQWIRRRLFCSKIKEQTTSSEGDFLLRSGKIISEQERSKDSHIPIKNWVDTSQARQI